MLPLAGELTFTSEVVVPPPLESTVILIGVVADQPQLSHSWTTVL